LTKLQEYLFTVAIFAADWGVVVRGLEQKTLPELWALLNEYKRMSPS
jgi:hypothetical protein